MENVTAFFDHNYSTNQSFAGKLNRTLVECSSNRFNLGMEDLPKSNEYIIAKLNKLIKKLRTVLIPGALSHHTSSRAKCNNSTRWSSTAGMIIRY